MVLRTEALALIEMDSVAVGLRALDALVKKAVVEVIEANLVEPGKYMVLFAGGVAEVEESYQEALRIAGEGVLGRMLLPRAHAGLLDGLRDPLAGAAVSREAPEKLDTLGVLEGSSVAATLEACDRALKDADIELAGIRVAGGLGGRAYFVVYGVQHDVEAGIEAGEKVLRREDALHRVELIPRPHREMVVWLLRPTPFSPSNANTR